MWGTLLLAATLWGVSPTGDAATVLEEFPTRGRGKWLKWAPAKIERVLQKSPVVLSWELITGSEVRTTRSGTYQILPDGFILDDTNTFRRKRRQYEVLLRDGQRLRVTIVKWERGHVFIW